MSVPEEDFYKTDDMTRAAFFMTMGHAVQRTIFERGICRWLFLHTEALERCIDDFEDGMAAVEPKLFARNRDNLRKAMHEKRQSLYSKVR